jgi:hypothetical protein
MMQQSHVTHRKKKIKREQEKEGEEITSVAVA